jgi:hypothetical protein
MLLPECIKLNEQQTLFWLKLTSLTVLSLDAVAINYSSYENATLFMISIKKKNNY